MSDVRLVEFKMPKSAIRLVNRSVRPEVCYIKCLVCILEVSGSHCNCVPKPEVMLFTHLMTSFRHRPRARQAEAAENGATVCKYNPDFSAT